MSYHRIGRAALRGGAGGLVALAGGWGGRAAVSRGARGQRLGHDLPRTVEVQRLDEVVERLAANGPCHCLQRPVCGNDDHASPRINLPEPLQHVKPVGIRQADVQKDDVRPGLGEPPLAFLARARNRHGKAATLEVAGKCKAYRLLVVDHQYVPGVISHASFVP